MQVCTALRTQLSTLFMAWHSAHGMAQRTQCDTARMAWHSIGSTVCGTLSRQARVASSELKAVWLLCLV